METRNGEKGKLMELLRRSVPDAGKTDGIEERILRVIREEEEHKYRIEGLWAGFFSWTEIAWIRKGLAAASLVLVIMFAWQQTLIMKRLGSLERMNNVSWKMYLSVYPEAAGMPGGTRINSMYLMLGKEVLPDEMLEKTNGSYRALEQKYLKLLDLIDNDPVLREYFENKYKYLPAGFKEI